MEGRSVEAPALNGARLDHVIAQVRHKAAVARLTAGQVQRADQELERFDRWREGATRAELITKALTQQPERFVEEVSQNAQLDETSTEVVAPVAEPSGSDATSLGDFPENTAQDQPNVVVRHLDPFTEVGSDVTNSADVRAGEQ